MNGGGVNVEDIVLDPNTVAHTSQQTEKRASHSNEPLESPDKTIAPLHPTASDVGEVVDVSESIPHFHKDTKPFNAAIAFDLDGNNDLTNETIVDVPSSSGDVRHSQAASEPNATTQTAADFEIINRETPTTPAVKSVVEDRSSAEGEIVVESEKAVRHMTHGETIAVTKKNIDAAITQNERDLLMDEESAVRDLNRMWDLATRVVRWMRDCMSVNVQNTKPDHWAAMNL